MTCYRNQTLISLHIQMNFSFTIRALTHFITITPLIPLPITPLSLIIQLLRNSQVQIIVQTLFFLSSRDIGLISTVNLLTELETLTDFEKDHFTIDAAPNYFEACFMTQGLHRNIVKIDLLHVNIIDSPSPFVQPVN